ncbi:DUF1937 family protein [Pseudaminobacter sp. NGMCC 1.201702]|uniref:DUF1937 family protein n=1 Tax=Pseudaminobacter sp. NGMCC 1.201702 TaxID=3391825 RepID=UPI0039EFB132
MQVGKIEYAPNHGRSAAGTLYDHPRNVPKLHWDSASRRYVEYDTEHMETFGEIGLYGKHTPVAVGAGTAANDNRPSLDPIRNLPGYVYLGSPYTLYPNGLHEAARTVALAASRLMARGLVIYSPIAHGHYIASHFKLPAEWEFWKRQCQPLMEGASSLIVLKMDGWADSVGLTYEIEWFHENGKPIVYLEPGALEERRAA